VLINTENRLTLNNCYAYNACIKFTNKEEIKMNNSNLVLLIAIPNQLLSFQYIVGKNTSLDTVFVLDKSSRTITFIDETLSVKKFNYIGNSINKDYYQIIDLNAAIEKLMRTVNRNDQFEMINSNNVIHLSTSAGLDESLTSARSFLCDCAEGFYDIICYIDMKKKHNDYFYASVAKKSNSYDHVVEQLLEANIGKEFDVYEHILKSAPPCLVESLKNSIQASSAKELMISRIEKDGGTGKYMIVSELSKSGAIYPYVFEFDSTVEEVERILGDMGLNEVETPDKRNFAILVPKNKGYLYGERKVNLDDSLFLIVVANENDLSKSSLLSISKDFEVNELSNSFNWSNKAVISTSLYEELDLKRAIEQIKSVDESSSLCSSKSVEELCIKLLSNEPSKKRLEETFSYYMASGYIQFLNLEYSDGDDFLSIAKEAFYKLKPLIDTYKNRYSNLVCTVFRYKEYEKIFKFNNVNEVLLVKVDVNGERIAAKFTTTD